MSANERTVKASEVVRGMRVRVEQPWGLETTRTVEGPIRRVEDQAPHFRFLTIGNGDLTVGPDHPVTVLAEPDPEWVEGAWYRVEINGNKTHARRVEGGWVRWDGVAYPTWEDIDRSRVVTVLGRVLIVDWPGDDVARELDAINDGNRSTSLSNYGRVTTHDTILRNVADAIRTQGGAPR